MTDLISVPVLVQKTAKPLSSGDGKSDLVCQCGQVLIVGYQSRQYVGLGFECSQCSELTLSEEWPVGEPLPKLLLTFPLGRYPMGDTVDVRGDWGIASESEVSRIKALTTIRPDDTGSLDLGQDALNAIELRINDLSSGEMLKASRRAKQAVASGNEFFLRSNLAWAIEHIRGCHIKGEIDLGSEKTQAALTFLQVSKHLMARWAHHPLFALISKSIVLEYPHTVAQLLAASHLQDSGNSIGFNDHAKFSVQSPDLFINVNFAETISLEVKAPAELQWPSKCPSLAEMERLLIKQIRNASKQITGEWGGVVIIGASWAGNEGHSILVQAMKRLDARKKISSRVAGVAAVSTNVLGHQWHPKGGVICSELVCKVDIQLNSAFLGEQFLIV